MSLRISVRGKPSAGLSARQVKYAIVMATAAMTSYVLSRALHLSGSYWSVLSAIIVFRFDFGNAFGASRDRLIGTIAGAVLAVSFLFLARLWSIPEKYHFSRYCPFAWISEVVAAVLVGVQSLSFAAKLKFCTPAEKICTAYEKPPTMI